MLAKTIYVCDLCGNTFDSAEECSKHEKNHERPIKIVKRFYSKISPVAHKIYVAGSDERVMEYSFSGYVDKA